MSTTTDTTQSLHPSGLAALEDRLRHDLEVLHYPRREWVVPRITSEGEPVLDVLIIGGGQSGLATAFGLRQEKITNILVIDRSPAHTIGPWKTFARMKTLRTPKHLIGPDWGIPNLTIRAWYEAQFGEGAWEKLGNIPKEMWADYLVWYRTLLQLPVESETTAGAIHWSEHESCFTVPLTHAGRTRTVYARKIVLAMGIEGSGRWQIPAEVRNNIPPTLYAHTHQQIDFDALVGKRVGVLGAGACAFDNAATALEHGAARVDQFYRRPEMVRINPYRWMEFVGFLKHHADLPDAERWRFIHQVIQMGQLPPADTYKRTTQFPNHTLHPGSPWTSVQPHGDGVRVTTPQGEFDFDFLILGTGFHTDLSLRSELAELHPHIALWSDRYTPPEGERNDDLARHPYLGPDFEMQEKFPGAAPYLSGIFNYTFGCLPSMGLGGASISGMKYSLPRLVSGLTRQFYAEDSGHYFATLCGYDVQDF
jgi:cation diffusion facilitator CzcD-associated flavoprotein CzcO